MILCKDLGATPFQIALYTILKPVGAMVSFYWSSCSKGRLRANVIGAGILMRLPFLLCPWFHSVWFLIAASVNYMLFYRAGTPAWLEILRRNLPEKERNRSFALSSAISYAEGAFLSLAMGSLLDSHGDAWKWLFVCAALVGMGSVFIQRNVPVVEKSRRALSLKELFVKPWKDSASLLRTKRDFARFQWGFMIGGFGIMLIQPAQALFTAHELGISYTQVAGAFCIAKGLGFALSSPLWAQTLQKKSIFRLSTAVFCLFSLFPFLLVLAKQEVSWLYFAHFLYGIGQGGSHLIWSISGSQFATKEEDSSEFTGVNIVLGGLRGIVAPSLGGWLLVSMGASAALVIGGVICLFGAWQMWQPEKKLVYS